jgi:hypothetical protein
VHLDVFGREPGIIASRLIIEEQSRLEGQSGQGGEIEFVADTGVETVQAVRGEELRAVRSAEGGRGIAHAGRPVLLCKGGRAAQQGGGYQENLDFFHVSGVLFQLQKYEKNVFLHPCPLFPTRSCPGTPLMGATCPGAARRTRMPSG